MAETAVVDVEGFGFSSGVEDFTGSYTAFQGLELFRGV